MELARKRLLRRLPFLLFLRSWRSFCDETVIFANVSSPFSRRQSQLLFYSKTFLARTIPPSTQATLAGSLSLFLSNSTLIPPASFCPLLFFRFAFASQVLLFLRIQLTPTRIPNKSPLGCPVWWYSCFLSLLIFPTVALKRLLFLLGSLCSTNSSWEHHIRADLLNNYDRKVRPVREGRREVTVQFSLRVGRLVKVVRQIIFGTPF